MQRKHIPELQNSGICLSHPRHGNIVTWPTNDKGSENVASLCRHMLSCSSVPMRGEKDRKHGVPSPSITDNPFLPDWELQTFVTMNHILLGQCFWRTHTAHCGFLPTGSPPPLVRKNLILATQHSHQLFPTFPSPYNQTNHWNLFHSYLISLPFK